VCPSRASTANWPQGVDAAGVEAILVDFGGVDPVEPVHGAVDRERRRSIDTHTPSKCMLAYYVEHHMRSALAPIW
jgi:hypothetical protein